MPEQKNKELSPPEGSSDEAVAAIRSLERAASDAEDAVRKLLQEDAAERIAEKVEPGDA